MKYLFIGLLILASGMLYFMHQSNKASAERLKQAEIAHQQAVQGLAWHMIWVREWWKEFGEPIRKLSPNMAGAVNDHFTDGAMFAFHFINQDDLKKQKERFEYHQWHLSCAERMALEYRNK